MCVFLSEVNYSLYLVRFLKERYRFFNAKVAVKSSMCDICIFLGCYAALSNTMVKDYHSTLRNSPEERRSYQHGGGSLKSQIVCVSL
jgi:hypothetical protein